MLTYDCTCGRKFDNSQSINAHKGHCGKEKRFISNHHGLYVCRFCNESTSNRVHSYYCKQNPDGLKNKENNFSKSQSARSKRRINLEKELVCEMEKEGYELLMPWATCDRIAIKDGKVYFVEFKPANDPTLRVGQQKVSDVAGDQYIIRFYKQ